MFGASKTKTGGSSLPVTPYTVTISPSYNGNTSWNFFTQGGLNVGSGSSTGYELTLTAQDTFSVNVKMWGAGGASGGTGAGGGGGYSYGTFTFVNGNVSVKSNLEFVDELINSCIFVSFVSVTAGCVNFSFNICEFKNSKLALLIVF